MDIKIIRDSISKKELENIAKNQFGDLVKVVVDVKQGIMAVGGELHSDEETLLLQNGSKQENLWGMNIYADKMENDFIKFDSMINVRPSQNNRSCGVENVEIRHRIRDIVSRLII